MDPIDALHRLGGVAGFSTLERLCGRSAIETRLKAGTLRRDARGRYSLPQVDEAVRAAGAVSGVLSHISAALHWGWEVKSVPTTPHVTVPRNRNVNVAQRRLVVPHWAELTADDVRDQVTARDRTVVDCLRSLPLDEGLAVADSVLRHGDLTPARMVRLADALTGPGAAQARKVARLADAAAANPFESVLRALSLDIPGLDLRPQVRIAEEGLFARPDLVDPELRIVVEADSQTWHNANRAQLRRDCLAHQRAQRAIRGSDPA